MPRGFFFLNMARTCNLQFSSLFSLLYSFLLQIGYLAPIGFGPLRKVAFSELIECWLSKKLRLLLTENRGNKQHFILFPAGECTNQKVLNELFFVSKFLVV